MWERLRCRRDGRDSGQDLVEYAIAFPVLMLLILGIIEFGVIIWSYDTIANAAREGARYGIIHPDETGETGEIQAVVRERALALPGQLDVIPTRNNENDTIEVRVTYDAVPFTPFFPSIHMETVATMRLEQRGTSP